MFYQIQMSDPARLGQLAKIRIQPESNLKKKNLFWSWPDLDLKNSPIYF